MSINHAPNTSHTLRESLLRAGFDPETTIANLLFELKTPIKVIKKINAQLGTHFYANNIQSWADMRGWVKDGKGSGADARWIVPAGWTQDKQGHWHPPESEN